MLEEDGVKILNVLVDHLEFVIPGNPETYITYKEVHDKLHLELKGQTYGESLKTQGLSNLAEWTAENNFPGITGLIIDGSTYQPGIGYYRVFAKDRDDFQWWQDQIRLSKYFDWKIHLPIEFIPEEIIPITTQVIDVEMPQREQVLVLRIIRDTDLTRRIKLIHNYECQICGQTIHLQNRKRYAESHHVKPLGNPHNGPDEPGNIICVCPNHHAELDYGASRINEEELISSPNHKVSRNYIDYHNTEIYRE
ncbi:MAG: HNH endonuclease [bacterium]|nr:HNH endonuclease [bacterium]